MKTYENANKKMKNKKYGKKMKMNNKYMKIKKYENKKLKKYENEYDAEKIDNK